MEVNPWTHMACGRRATGKLELVQPGPRIQMACGKAARGELELGMQELGLNLSSAHLGMQELELDLSVAQSAIHVQEVNRFHSVQPASSADNSQVITTGGAVRRTHTRTRVEDLLDCIMKEDLTLGGRRSRRSLVR